MGEHVHWTDKQKRSGNENTGGKPWRLDSGGSAYQTHVTQEGLEARLKKEKAFSRPALSNTVAMRQMWQFRFN